MFRSKVSIFAWVWVVSVLLFQAPHVQGYFEIWKQLLQLIMIIIIIIIIILLLLLLLSLLLLLLSLFSQSQSSLAVVFQGQYIPLRVDKLHVDKNCTIVSLMKPSQIYV